MAIALNLEQRHAGIPALTVDGATTVNWAYRLSRFALWPITAVLLTSVPASAQDTLRLTRLADPVVIDGRVDEAVWESVPVLPLTQFAPQYRGEPSRQTEIRVAYDDSYVYVSGRLFADPGSIRANTVYRDAFAGDDLFSIALDTYNDYQTAVWFVVNPAGGRIDQTLSNDGERTNLPPYNFDWNTFWQYNSVDDLASVNARLRYNVRDGSDLWIVYNEVVNTDRDSRLPIPPLSQGRAVMVKYTHTLVW